ncbi:MAG: tRNA (adenosine(37)-N6)-threonylcarbamoyltransferase complex dimerization subunit type 1 TsaB [Deltaproteobacteria bacterium]|nr:tRNA (adenosine(37)-N6)-threonylcarbamoyltransferase complex dimerization subunit type 1 TsaB [Deltaproteobacteria bacterium]
MNLLAVDTSTWTAGVAVLRDDQLVASLEVTRKKTHAQRLLRCVDTALRLSGLVLDQCDAFAVTVGPGSFTGLRIGVSTVKGLAFATGKPVAAVSTLKALAFQFPCSRELVCPMLDARKGQIFTALYRWDPVGQWQEVMPEVAADPEAWLSQMTEPCLFVGDGTVVYKKIIKQRLGPQAWFAPEYLNTPRSVIVAHIGAQQIRAGAGCDPAVLVPCYLRKSDAELKRNGLSPCPKDVV